MKNKHTLEINDLAIDCTYLIKKGCKHEVLEKIQNDINIIIDHLKRKVPDIEDQKYLCLAVLNIKYHIANKELFLLLGDGFEGKYASCVLKDRNDSVIEAFELIQDKPEKSDLPDKQPWEMESGEYKIRSYGHTPSLDF